tara:strand:+ start:215535 stop:216947 length:1413 start_codon:yes stop_codon:yes gene_type:complete
MLVLSARRLLIVLAVFASTQLSAQNLPDFTELVEKSAPAIVNVAIRSTVGGDQDLEDFDGSLEQFEEFLRLFGDRLPEGFGIGEQQRSSLGSGFIISENGYIVTNHHVIEDADEITVTLNDQRQFKAEIIGSDQRSDLALLKIEAEGLPTVSFGEATNVKVGQWVLAIGSPFNLSHSVAAGIVSYVGRSLPENSGQGNYVSFIQTDVAINPGHSGGPLFNLAGEVIGVNSQIYSNSGGSIGLSFAIPVDVAANVIGQLMNSGNVARGWMGVSIANLTQEQADSYNLSSPKGAFVNDVLPGGPAEAAGFQAEDIIVSYNGDEIRNSADLPYHVGLSMPGTEVEIGLIRSGRSENIRMVVGDLDAAATRQQIQLSSLEPLQNYLGMSISELTDAEKSALGLDFGLRIDAVTGPVAQRAGLQSGDIILSLNNRELNSLEEFASITSQLPADRPLPLLVERDGQQSFFTLRLEG